MQIPTTTEEINDLLEYYFIYRDDLLNFVTCVNLIANTDEGPRPVWEAAARTHTVQIVPLRELIHLRRVTPISGKKIWVVENSGVCATLLDYRPETPIICTNGQFTLAAFVLMDLLVKNGCILYYAGDFDPEGLGMAQRLIDRYDQSVRLWHMDRQAYLATKPTQPITTERLEKLNRLTDDTLLQVANDMRHLRKTGYQEALVEQMKKDIE